MNNCRYEPFYKDFGPLNLSQLWRYCHFIHEKIKDPARSEQKIVHWTGVCVAVTQLNG
jgi:hypothetical protein